MRVTDWILDLDWGLCNRLFGLGLFGLIMGIFVIAFYSLRIIYEILWQSCWLWFM